MIEDNYHCPCCHILYNLEENNPRKMFNCNHSLCSSCINKLLNNNKNKSFICPIDSITYSNIQSIDNFKEEKPIIDEINYQPLYTSPNPKSIMKKLEEQFKDNIIISNNSPEKKNIIIEKQIKDIDSGKKSLSNYNSTNISIHKNLFSLNYINNAINNKNLKINISNNYSIPKCYIKKTIKFNKSPSKRKNFLICKIHSLPLNVICIDECAKICSHCALENQHLNHKIITDHDFDVFIDDLVRVFHNIELNQIKFSNFKNINSKQILEEINQQFIELNKIVKDTKKQMINKLNIQCKKIKSYLNLRKDEIFNKYQNANYDISSLKDSTNKWINIVSEKLKEANNGTNEEPIIDYLKLLDKDSNKNIFDLISSGKQFNERYNFIQETKSIINKLILFKQKGISITPNNELIENIFNKSNKNENTNKSNCNQNLFIIEENKELIKSLNLSPFSSLFKDDEVYNNLSYNSNFGEKSNNDSNLDDENSNYNTFKHYNCNNNMVLLSNTMNKKNNIYFRKAAIELDKLNLNNFPNNIQNTNDNNNNNTFNNLKSLFSFSNIKITDINNKSKIPKEENVHINFKYKKIFPRRESICSPFIDDIKNESDNCIKFKIPKNLVFQDKKSISDELSMDDVNQHHIHDYNSDSNISLTTNFHNKNCKINTKKKKNSVEIQKKTRNTNQFSRCVSCVEKIHKVYTKNSSLFKKNISTNNLKPKNNLNNDLRGSNANMNKKNYNSNNNKIVTKLDDVTFKEENKKKENCSKKKFKTLPTTELEKYVKYQLKKLKPNFNRINLNSIGIKYITLFFQKNESRKYYEMKLQGCNLTDDDFIQFVQSIIDNNIILPAIYFSENKLTDDCFDYILDFIKQYKLIKSLSFNGNLFTKSIKDKMKEIIKNEYEGINILF